MAFGPALALLLTLAHASAPEGPGAAASTATADAERWIYRLRPTGGMLELGVFAGVWLAPEQHQLVDPLVPTLGPRYPGLAPVSPDFGARALYLFERYFGLEASGSFAPARTDDGQRSFLYRGGIHVLWQLPNFSLTPYALLGLGFAAQSGATLGTDVDPAVHLGGGLKFYVHERVALQLDARDAIAADGGGRAHHVQINLGVAVTLLRGRRRPLPDRDGDGVPDPGPRVKFPDACPDQPGFHEFNGCPPPQPPAELPIHYHGGGGG